MCYVKVVLLWIATPRNVASLLTLILWLYCVKLTLSLGSRCGVFFSEEDALCFLLIDSYIFLLLLVLDI